MSANAPTDLHDPAGVSTAARSAVAFLLNAQGPDGDWKDFLLPAGKSNVWVTGYVGGVLAERPEPGAREAALAGWRFLKGAKTADGGWSYNQSVPGDADSTLWGLRLAETLGVEDSESFRLASAFLERHFREDGGLATYESAAPVRRYIGLPPFVPFDGWTQSHVCVTAACANLVAHAGRLRQYLLRTQTEEGKWIAYWWFDDEYSTAEAVAALAGRGGTAARREPEVDARIGRAAAWALKRVEKLTAVEGSRPPAFALAHALRVAARAPRSPEARDAITEGAKWLCEWQKPDGSWPASAGLRVPRPDALAPDAGDEWTMWAGMPAVTPSLENVMKHTFSIYSPDHHGVYTTATVLRALHEISHTSD